MKLKKLFALAVTAMFTVGASAQTDVTSTYVKNASFEDGQTWYVKSSGGDCYKPTDWTSESFASNSWSYSVMTTDEKSEGSNSFKIRFNWSNATYTLEQMIENLPAGYYTLEADVKAYSDNGSTENAYIKGNDTKGEVIKVSTTAFSKVKVDVSLLEGGDLNVILGMDYRFDTRTENKKSAQGIYYWDNVKLTMIDPLTYAKNEALALLPETAGDNLFTMSQESIEDFTQQINNATTVDAVNDIKTAINDWAAPALTGTWNIKNATIAFYLGVDGENIVLSEAPVAVSFEKATNGFYIKAGDYYINMKGNDNWSMSATTNATTAWSFTLNDGKYTIQGPKGLIGTDATTAGSYCYGNKTISNNGEWTITAAVSEEEIALTLAKNALENALSSAPSVPTVNIGSEAFQYNAADVETLSSKIATAQSVLESTTATKDEVDAQTEIVSALAPLSLNAPEATQAYHLVFNCEGHDANGNALTLIPNPSQTQGGYGLKYLAPANTNLAQAFYFTHTSGNKYKISAIDQEGKVRYITTQAEGYGTTWYEGIRTIEEDAITETNKPMEVEIRPNGDGLYLLWNTGADKAIAHNGNSNNDCFTNNTANFQLVSTDKASVTVNTTAAGWGTVMFPFAVATLPENVKAYTCSELKEDGATLQLVEVKGGLEANKPYIIEGVWDETLEGDAKGAALTYTDGYLTGVYANTQVPVGSYVLLNESQGVGFYEVVADDEPTATANRAYLTVPAATEVKSFFALGSFESAIKNVVKVQKGEAIYNLAGQRMKTAMKGVNIIGGKKVVIR